ncbi:MAG TPA: hypothetical protein VHH72_01840 [Solirubrobacterales bacterium]|nr:hypothetical protein [Solirubrobacterales bacterium]
MLALIALASLISFLAVFSIWANRQALETDNWVETSTELLEDEEIRTQLAAFMVDTLYANVDVQAELEARLPPNLKGLAGPAAGGIRQLADRLANEALQRPRVQQAWERINRTTHEKLLQVIEEDTGEPVTLDLGSLVAQVGGEAGINVAGRLPPDAGQIEVLPAGELSTAQKLVDLIETLAVVLTVIAILLFALAIYLARGWRREALRAVGFSLIVVGLAVAVARSLAGNVVVDALASTASVEPAVEDTWEISTSLLSDGAGAMVFYGIIIVLGAWLAGPTGLARGVRRTLAPAFHHRGVGYALLFAFLLLLFWLAPTEGFRRLPISLVIIALFVIGFEMLRRQTVREFPDETWEAGSERWRERGRSLLDRRRRGGG